VFAVALIAGFSPSKALGATSGLLAVLAVLFVFPRQRIGNISRVLSILILYGLFGALHLLLENSTHVFGILLFLVTHAHFVLFALRPGRQPSRRDLKLLFQIAFWMLVIQAPLGLSQAAIARARTGSFDYASGDAVNGTLDPLVALVGASPRGSNVAYGILVVTLVSVIFGLGERYRDWILGTMGLFAFILGSIVHLNLFLFLSSLTVIGIAAVARFFPRSSTASRDLRNRIAVPAAFAAAFVVAIAILPHNYGTFRTYVGPEVETVLLLAQEPGVRGLGPQSEEGVDLGPTAPSARFENHKLRIVVITFRQVPETHPWAPIIGVGPGQFNSRAGLIASGLYLEGFEVPDAHRRVSRASAEHFMPLWLGGLPPLVGSSWFPFFSVLATYAELGVVGLLVAAAAFVLIVRRIARINSYRPRLLSATMVLLLFLVSIGTYENYWEWSQAITVGVVFIWTISQIGDLDREQVCKTPSTGPRQKG
jgi:hypothetical protein